jgi:hypothetical protein
MMWHVVFAEQGGLPKSRAVKSREAAIQAACELLAKSSDVRRIIEPSGTFIDRAELANIMTGAVSPGCVRRLNWLSRSRPDRRLKEPQTPHLRPTTAN